MNDNSDVVAALNTTADGGPSLTLFDKDGKARLTVSLDHDGNPFMTLFDKGGRERRWKS